MAVVVVGVDVLTVVCGISVYCQRDREKYS